MESEKSEIMNKFYNITSKSSNIILLKQLEVIQWLLGDLTYLPEIEKKNKTQDNKKYKILEDEWGQNMLEKKRPDLKKHGQWTTKLGEHICEELLIILGKTPHFPENKKGYEPDIEVEDAIWEVKAQTYFTDGTAGEKILGVPFKYADVPELYGKPLKILCIGRAEELSRNHYGNLYGSKTTEKKKKFVEFYKENGIEWIGATELIKQIVTNNSL